MLTPRRVILATVLGFVFGLVCLFLAASNPEAGEALTSAVKWNIVLSRTLTGFMIGISALRLKWWLHGIVLGAIGSIPMAVATMDDARIALGSLVMGIVYGFLIELITSLVFKARPVATRH